MSSAISLNFLDRLQCLAGVGISVIVTSGLLTSNSYPSRRMVSIRMPGAARRPLTMNRSGWPLSATRSAVAARLVDEPWRSRRDVPQPAALAPGERAGVDAKRHADGRLVDGDGGQRLFHSGIGDRVADAQARRSRRLRRCLRPRLLDFLPGKVMVGEQVDDFALFALALRCQADSIHHVATLTATGPRRSAPYSCRIPASSPGAGPAHRDRLRTGYLGQDRLEGGLDAAAQVGVAPA